MDWQEMIKSKLDQHRVPYSPDAWQDMMNRLDEIDQDAQVDDRIQHQLNTIEPPYQSNHWIQLKQWLDFNEYVHRKLYLSKASELALLMLALWTYSLIEPGIHPHMKTLPNDVAHVDNRDLSVDMSYTTEGSMKSKEGHTFHLSDGVLSDQIITRSTSHVIENQIAWHDEITSDSESRMNNTDPIVEAGLKSTELINHQQLESTSYEKTTPEHHKHVSKDQSTSSIAIADHHQLNSSKQRAMQPHIAKGSQADLPSIQYSSVNPLSISPAMSIDYTTPVAHRPLTSNKNYTPAKWSISGFANLDLNFIYTPYDPLYGREGYQQHIVGSGGGVGVHRHLGSFDIMSGLMYSSKKYTPRQFIELFKRSQDSDGTAFAFNGIQLNMLSIPLHLAYTFHRGNRFQSYASVGTALHLALQADYNHSSYFVSRRTSVADFVESNGGVSLTLGENPRFDKKEFPDGLLENGSFDSNHFVSLNAALGLEYKLLEGTRMLLQPTLYYNVFNKGMGANNDRIHIMTVQLGIRQDL